MYGAAASFCYMKVALVHDYLREYGGAERVVEALHEIWPDAPLYTAFVDWQALGAFGKKFKGWDIRTTWAQNFLMKKFHSPLRFLTPLVWESLNLNGFDVVISSSGWYMCRGVVTRPETLHVSYIHHPPRNLYGLPTGSSPNKLVQAYAAFINPFLRVYDYASVQRVDFLVANSETTRQRIKKFYRREAEVIYPPVAVISRQSLVIRKKDYFLSVGRLNYAKRIDLAIEACNRLKLPLKIVGTGKEETRLKALAARPPAAVAAGAAGWRSTVEFLGAVSDEELVKLYSGAKALIFTALEEDFGLVPIEAMSCGTPVITLKQGGVMETVIDGKTGIFFDKPEVDNVMAAIKKFQKLKLKPQDCTAQAAKFSKDKFKEKIKALVEDKYGLLRQQVI